MKQRNSPLVDFFAGLATNFQSLEAKKAPLAKLDHASFAYLFKIIDQQQKGSISLTDVYNYLKAKSMHLTESEIFGLFQELDVKRKGELDVQDLIYAFKGSQQSGVNTPFNKQCEDRLLEFFDQILANHSRSEMLKQKLKDINVDHLFGQLDYKHKGILTLDDLQHFLKSNQFSDTDIKHISLYLQNAGLTNMTVEDFRCLVSPVNEILTTRQIDVQPTTNKDEPKMNTYEIDQIDDMFKTKSKQNQDRRNELKENERIRNKIMQEVLERKKKFMDLEKCAEADNYKRGSVHKVSHQKMASTFGSDFETCKKQTKYEVIINSPQYEQKTNYSPVVSQFDQSTLLTRVKSDPKFNYQLDQRPKTAQRFNPNIIEARTNQPSHHTVDLQSKYEALLNEKHYELQAERSKNEHLERQLLKSRNEVELLKRHLENVGCFKQSTNLNASLEKPVKRATAEIISRLGSPNKQSIQIDKQNYEPCRLKEDITKNFKEQLKKLRQDLFGLNKRTETAAQKISKFDTNMSLSKESLEGKGLLDQALRRSKIEREFAKLKLEKQLEKTRCFWK